MSHYYADPKDGWNEAAFREVYSEIMQATKVVDPGIERAARMAASIRLTMKALADSVAGALVAAGIDDPTDREVLAAILQSYAMLFFLPPAYGTPEEYKEGLLMAGVNALQFIKSKQGEGD